MPDWCGPPRYRPTLGVALLATLALLVAGPTAVAAASVSADCAGAGGGAAFVADSNLTVYYNDTQPMPDSGVFLNDSAVEFRNVTVVANGTASLRLENGTGNATCYGDVDATATPITIAPAEGGTALVVEGLVAALSVGPETVDAGNATLAYDAPGPWNASLAVGESDGTDLEARNATSGSVLADGAVDGGSLELTLPAGSHAVVLASAPGPGGNGTTTPTATATPTTRARSGGGGGGGGGSDPTATRTATATPLPTATAESTATATATRERTATATIAVASSAEPTAGPPVERGGGSIPILGVVVAVALVGAAGAGLIWRRRG